MNNYDFGGYATRNDLLCEDGRTIKKDAFKDNDGTTVPLIGITITKVQMQF